MLPRPMRRQLTIEEYQATRREAKATDATLGCLCAALAGVIVLATIVTGVVISID